MGRLTNKVITGESLKQLTAFGIYKIYHIKKPDFFYVGSASGNYGEKDCRKGFYRRFLMHIHNLEHKKHTSKFLQNVVNKYGVDGLRFEVIEIIDSKDRTFILKREQYYIDLISPQYNMSSLARCPTVPFTKERRKAASERMKGKSLEHLHEKSRIKVKQYTKEGEYIQTFNSIKEAAVSVKIHGSFLSKHLSGHKPSAGGYIWEKI